MFDIGFWELGLISVVALLVVGPERLPGLARTVGLWLGKGRRMLSSIKDEIDREVRVEEIKKTVQESVQTPVKEGVRQAIDPMQTIQQEAEKIMSDARAQLEEGSKHKKKDTVKTASSDGAHDEA